jgi:hypothetical protein
MTATLMQMPSGKPLPDNIVAKFEILGDLNRQVAEVYRGILLLGRTEDEARVLLLDNIKALAWGGTTLDEYISNAKGIWHTWDAPAFDMINALMTAYSELQTKAGFSPKYAQTVLFSHLRELVGGSDLFNKLIGYVNPSPMPPVEG